VRTLDRAGDLLICECGRRYPIIDEVPIVMANPAAYLRSEIATVVERDLPPEVAALLVADGPDEAHYARLLEHLSIYIDAHWADREVDRARPPDGFALGSLIDRLASLPRVELAVELGCSAGRVVAELAVNADRVVGLDINFGAVRRARHLLDGEPLAYGRRVIGRHYARVEVAAGALAVAPQRRRLVCGDALDPPLIQGMFDRVVALNVLDSVRQPRQLLSVVDGLCAPHGELIVSSPYSWQSTVMEDHERLGGADPAIDVAAILRDGEGLGARYRIEDEAEVPWTLRRDARSTVAYRVHYLRARKL
jgi:SAM-dependent methyltransferase